MGRRESSGHETSTKLHEISTRIHWKRPRRLKIKFWGKQMPEFWQVMGTHAEMDVLDLVGSRRLQEDCALREKLHMAVKRFSSGSAPHQRIRRR